MKARNKVIAGDYKGESIIKKSKLSEPYVKEAIGIILKAKFNFFRPQVEYLYFTSETIENYDVIHQESEQKISGVGVGTSLSSFSGSIEEKTVYTISIQFKDGKKSVIEIDDKFYEIFLLGVKLWSIDDIEQWSVKKQEVVEEKKVYQLGVRFDNGKEDILVLEGELYKEFLERVENYRKLKLLRIQEEQEKILKK